MRVLISYLVLFLIFCGCISAQGQADSAKWKFQLDSGPFSYGYLFQHESVFELGLKMQYVKLRKNVYYLLDNVSLIPGAQLTWRNHINYVNPFVMLRYLKPFSSKLGGVISFSWCNKNVLGVTSNILTPEVGINFRGEVNITYGYNLFPDNKYTWVSPNRVTFRAMFN